MSASLKRLTGEYDKPGTGLSTIGLIVLQSDVVMEAELRAWLSGDLRLLHTRIPNSTAVSVDTLCAMEQALPAAASLLPSGIPYAAIAYGCTSASTLIGETRVQTLIGDLFPGVPVTNPITAVRARLADLGVSRIAVLTPYTIAVSRPIIEHLESHGLKVVGAATFDEPDDRRVARLSAASIQEAILELGAQPDCEAVFASCTNLRSLPILADTTRRLGKPVLTSNSALAWHLRELAAGAQCKP